MSKSTITITFSNGVENHNGNQLITTGKTNSFSVEELNNIPNAVNHNLTTLIPKDIYDKMNEKEKIDIEASLLVIKNGIEIITDNKIKAKDLYNEIDNLPKDAKYFDNRRKKVLNKHARQNNCIADFDQPPNYEKGEGTVISFNRLPLLSIVREKLPNIFGDKAEKLYAETNYYKDITKNGIGYHGDTELYRDLVLGVRLGATMPLVLQWFYKNKPIGNLFRVDLENGDVYAFSKKTVGRDWKSSSKYTLRHAAGADKYIIYKPRKPSKPSKE